MYHVLGVLGWALFHSFWQLTGVGLLAALLFRVAVRGREQAQYRLALAAMAACLMLPVLTFSHGLMNLAAPTVAAPAFPATLAVAGTLGSAVSALSIGSYGLAGWGLEDGGRARTIAQVAPGATSTGSVGKPGGRDDQVTTRPVGVGAGAGTAWTESNPVLVMKLPKGSNVLVQGASPQAGVMGEARFTLDGTWKTFAFKMDSPKPE